MTEVEPSPAEFRLWLARIKAEQAAGTSPEDANLIMREIISSWRAVRDGAVVETVKPENQVA